MEKLAMTCKILYDVDILNKMETLEREKTHPVIVFQDLFNYFNRAKNFQIKIRHGIHKILTDTNILNSVINELENISDFNLFIKMLNDIIFKELCVFTQQKYIYWCKNTSINILNAVKGGLKGLSFSLTNRENEDVEGTILITKNMIISTSLCIIFNIMGNHDLHQGIFDQISYFKCDICKKIKNEVILMEKMVCNNCV